MKKLANVHYLWTMVTVFVHGALRPQKPYGLLETGKGGGVGRCVCVGGGGGVGYLRVARPSNATRKDRRDRQPPPEQRC